MDHPEPKGRKVVFMLTLKELKKIVKVADVEKRIPSVKSLKEHKVVVKEMINADTTISVYDHGYVLYTAGNQSTVFPLHSCDDYEYVSVTGDNKEFNKEFFDNENWYIRLLMEAEDRMAYSQSKISTNHGVFSNSDVTDDAEIMRGSSKDFVDDVIDREILNALIKELTERQKTVLNLVYFEEMRQQDVADYLGIKQQSVNDLLNRALKWSGFSIAKDTLEPLIGQRVPAELYQKISQMVESYDGIIGTHDLIVHNYGPNQGMATIHAEVPNDVNIEVSHAIIDRIEREVGKELNITLVIHMDPVELHDAEVLRLKEKTEHIIKALDSKLSFHDFRLVKTTPVNLIFDLLVPAEYTQKDTDRVLHQLMQLISEMEAGATCVITVDHSFEAPEE